MASIACLSKSLHTSWSCLCKRSFTHKKVCRIMSKIDLFGLFSMQLDIITDIVQQLIFFVSMSLVLPYLVKLHKSGLFVSKTPFEKYLVKKASFFLQNFWLKKSALFWHSVNFIFEDFCLFSWLSCFFDPLLRFVPLFLEKMFFFVHKN